MSEENNEIDVLRQELELKEQIRESELQEALESKKAQRKHRSQEKMLGSVVDAFDALGRLGAARAGVKTGDRIVSKMDFEGLIGDEELEDIETKYATKRKKFQSVLDRLESERGATKEQLKAFKKGSKEASNKKRIQIKSKQNNEVNEFLGELSENVGSVFGKNATEASDEMIEFFENATQTDYPDLGLTYEQLQTQETRDAFNLLGKEKEKFNEDENLMKDYIGGIQQQHVNQNIPRANILKNFKDNNIAQYIQKSKTGKNVFDKTLGAYFTEEEVTSKPEFQQFFNKPDIKEVINNTLEENPNFFKKPTSPVESAPAEPEQEAETSTSTLSPRDELVATIAKKLDTAAIKGKDEEIKKLKEQLAALEKPKPEYVASVYNKKTKKRLGALNGGNPLSKEEIAKFSKQLNEDYDIRISQPFTDDLA